MKFIEITAKGEAIGLLNIMHIVNIINEGDTGISITLTDGSKIHTDMSYEQLKRFLLGNNESIYNDPDTELYFGGND